VNSWEQTVKVSLKEDKVVSVQAMMVCGGGRGKDPPLVNLVSR